MTYYSNPDEPSKICSVCESKSYRAFSEEIGLGTIFALEPWELVDSNTGETRPVTQLTQPLGLTAYICSDRKCGHVDLYAHSVDRHNPSP